MRSSKSTQHCAYYQYPSSRVKVKVSDGIMKPLKVTVNHLLYGSIHLKCPEQETVETESKLAVA